MTDRWSRHLALLSGLLVTGSVSCVYFNTYYNAEKYFRQAEKARTEGEEDRGGRRAGYGYESLYDKAVRKASIVLEKHPDSELVDDAMFLAGRALYWQRDFAYGARSFQDLEENFPESEYIDRARLWRARCLKALGTEAEARSQFTALVLEHSSTGDRAGLELGDMAAAGGDLRGAIYDYRTTLSAFPRTPLVDQLWLRIGNAHLALQSGADLDSAVVAYDRALEETREDSVEYRARLNRGRVLHRQGWPDQALDAYRSLLREGRFRTWEGETRILIGQHYRQSGALSAALDEFERVRDDFPGTPVSAMALYETGLVYLQDRGDRQQAQGFFGEVGLERRGCEADSLAREILQTTERLDDLLHEIYRADSTAAALQLSSLADPEGGGADTSLAGGPVPGASLDPAGEPASLVDSLATVGEFADSLAAARDRVDSLATARDSTSAQAADSIAAAEEAPSLQPLVPEGLEGYVVDFDSLGRWLPLVALPPLEEGPAGEQRARERRRRQRLKERPGSARQPTLMDNLFSAAEVYRDRLGLPDSAAVLYQEIADRFPGSPQVPRALFNRAWTHIERSADTTAARPILERLVADHPATVHASVARGYLGLPSQPSAEEQAAEVFAGIEKMRLDSPEDPALWVPGLDELAGAFPGTQVAAQAAFLAAWATENVQGDSAGAGTRYDSILALYPGSSWADLVDRRRQAERDGLIDRLGRELKALSEGTDPGQILVLVAVEPVIEDSISRARNHLGFGMRALRRGDFDTAEELFQLSLDEKDSRNTEPIIGLGEANWQQGYLEDAVGYMRRALGQRAGSILPHYRLFAYHVQQGREDSANSYLRTIARRDREAPSVNDLLLSFPGLATGESEPLDLDALERVKLEPEEEVLEVPPGYFGVAEPPLVRSSRTPEYPGGNTDSTSVLIDVLVSETGRPEQVSLYRGEEPFASAALAAVEGYTFYPAEGVDERPVRTWVEVAVDFEPVSPEAGEEVAVTEAVGAAAEPPLVVEDPARAEASRLPGTDPVPPEER